MQKIEVSDIFIYPIKSTFGLELTHSLVESIGLKYDRNFAIIDANNKVITGRENPNLLKIVAEVTSTQLTLKADGITAILNLGDSLTKSDTTVTLFKDLVNVKVVDDEINTWISSVIGEPSRLVLFGADNGRKMKPKYFGKENDFIAFSDVSAIHLITKESLDDLNSKLEKPTTINCFRPNIVVRNCKPYEEESWSSVTIGDCIFDVVIHTERCSFITINPKTRERDINQEPLRTLANNKRGNKKVNFGIYLIPRKLGVIKVSDEVKIKY